jgi:hypothetical protein
MTAVTHRVRPQTERTGAATPTVLSEYVRASGLLSLVVAASKDPNAKLTVLLISPDTGRPVIAIKAPTTDLAARAVRVERQVLLELHTRVSDRIRASIPAVVDSVAFEGRTALVTTALPGAPMTTTYHGWRHTASKVKVGGDFATVASWLADLQTATARDRTPIDLDGGVAARLESRFADDPEIGSDLERLAVIHERLARDTTPLTLSHGDFWFGNILIEDERVSGVVDWEAGSATGEPVRDLVRFANMYALYLDRSTKRGREVSGHPGLRAEGFGAGLEFALGGNGWFPDLFRHFLQHGLTRLGASPDNWRSAAMAGIAEVAAFTDEHEFARHHLQLFRRINRSEGPHGS